MHFFVQLVLLLTAALVLGRAAARLKTPRVVGEILAGILLGPTCLGAAAPALQAWLFAPTGAATTLRVAVSRLALLVFLFVAGQETQLPANRAEAQRVLSVSLFGLAVPFLIAWVAALAVPRLFGSDGLRPEFPLFLGTALSISALPVIARIFIDLRLEQSALAATVLSAAAIDDLVGWGLFVILLNKLRSGEAFSLGSFLLLGGLVFVVWRWRSAFAGWITRSMPKDVLLPVFGVLMLALSAGVEALGFHGIFGAFLAGVLCGDLRSSAAAKTLRQAALTLLAPLYFVGIGLQIHLGRDFSPLLAGVLLAIACAGKILGGAAGARLSGQSWRNALAVGCAMNARGAMEIILATVALEHAVIGPQLHAGLVFVALATSLMVGPCLKLLRYP